jgi:hypothetical protein
VTGESAVFDPRANLITMVGGVNGVVLTQCKNVLSGDRLKVDMTTRRVARRIRQQGEGPHGAVGPGLWLGAGRVEAGSGGDTVTDLR